PFCAAGAASEGFWHPPACASGSCNRGSAFGGSSNFRRGATAIGGGRMNTRCDGDADEGRKTIRTMILLALWTGSVVLLSLWPIGPLATSWNEFTRELASGIGPSVGWPIWETVA